jgi:hypothetical protein
MIVIPFFCSSKRKELKKRRPEKTTGSAFRHLRKAISRSKKQNPVRTPDRSGQAFPGLPRHTQKSINVVSNDMEKLSK